MFLHYVGNDNQTTRRHIPNDTSCHSPDHENLKTWARIGGGGDKVDISRSWALKEIRIKGKIEIT
jgi:hypothetical protein